MAIPQKVCYIYSAVAGYLMFIEDFRKSVIPNKIIDLDYPFLSDVEYVFKYPNVILSGFASLCFCKVGDMLYMFEGSDVGGDFGKGALKIGVDEAKERRVYLFSLSTLDCTFMSSNLLHRDEFQHSSNRMLGPKVKPAAIRYLDDKIVVFSTYIHFLTCDGNDFEMYITGENRSWSLPCLSVCYVYCIESGVARYTLYDSTKGCAKIAARTVREAGVRARTYSFDITAFALVGDYTLVVQTDFGLLFSLDLVQGEWQFWDGPVFPYGHQNIVTENGLVLCPSGASVYTRGGYGSPGVTVPFPLSSRVSPKYIDRNSFISLEHVEFPYYFVSILQVSDTGDETPISTIDLVKVNALNFMSDEEFAERMLSFTFNSGVCGSVAAEGLFFY